MKHPLFHMLSYFVISTLSLRKMTGWHLPLLLFPTLANLMEDGWVVLKVLFEELNQIAILTNEGPIRD